MATGNFNRTDLNELNYIVQNTQHAVVKDLIISVIRDEFSKDSYYHFVKDQWGFPKTPDLTGKPLSAGYKDDETTRIFIGEKYRFNSVFYPAILVSTSTMKSKPISFNREKETIKYDPILIIDGYGHSKLYSMPVAVVAAGAWEGTVDIEILTRDIYSRDEISSFLLVLFEHLKRDELYKAGVWISSVSSGGDAEEKDRGQDTRYKRNITLDIRTEWRQEIPVNSIVEVITFCVELGRVDVDPPIIAPNMTIASYVSVVDELENL